MFHDVLTTLIPNSLEGEIRVDADAAASVSRQGTEIGLGQRTTRLAIAGLDDERFLVPVLILKKGEGKEVNVQEVGGKLYFHASLGAQEAWVEVDEFAQRLHFSKDKVIEAAQAGNIGTLLGKRANFDQVLNQYGKILTTYENDAPKDISFTNDLLMKMVRVGLREIDRNGDGGASFQVRELRVLGNRDIKGNLQMAIWKGRTDPQYDLGHDEHLGTGSFGVAMKVFDIATGKQAALKLARQDFSKDAENLGLDEGSPNHRAFIKVQREKAVEEVLHEASFLHTIHSNGLVEGLIRESRAIVNITGDQQIQGFWGDLFVGGDVFDLVVKGVKREAVAFVNGGIENRSYLELLVAVRGMLRGGAALHAQGIVHGDIKTENMFAEEDAQGQLRFLIADLGGATLHETVWKRALFAAANGDRTAVVRSFGTITRHYLSKEEGDRLSVVVLDAFAKMLEVPQQCFTNGRSINFAELKREFTRRQEARDALALGISAYFILSGSQDPLYEDENGYADVYSGINKYPIYLISPQLKVLIKHYGIDVAYAIKGLVHCDPLKRLTVQQALDAIDPFVEEMLNPKTKDQQDMADLLSAKDPYAWRFQDEPYSDGAT